jgi:hypothetical protein
VGFERRDSRTTWRAAGGRTKGGDDESLKAYLAPTGLVSEPRGDLIFRGDRGLVSEPRGDLTYRGDLTCRGDLRLEVPKTGLKQHKFYSVNNTCSGLFGAVRGCSGLFGAVRGCSGLFGAVISAVQFLDQRL